MKKAFLLLVLFFVAGAGRAQQFYANYEVTRTLVTGDKNHPQKIADLPLDGFIYYKGPKLITFLRPKYLENYPSGNIEIIGKDGTVEILDILMDTLQSLTYLETDSMVYRNCMEIAGLNAESMNYVFLLKKEGYQKNWEILSEFKTIMGLPCRRAQMKDKQGNITTDVWFTDSVAVPMNLFGKLGLPGLMIQGTVYDAMDITTFSLKNFNFSAAYPDSVFWPDSFNRLFSESREFREKYGIN